MRPNFLTSIENRVFRSLLLLPKLWEQDGSSDTPAGLASQARRLAKLSQMFPRFEQSSLSYARRQLHLSNRMMMRPAAPGVRASYKQVETRSRQVRYLYLQPESSHDESPLILYFHGGGWTLGQHDTLNLELSWLAYHSKMRLASFDYLLAPEHPYPAPVQDCYEIFEAFVDSSQEKYPLVVAGDSAGGHLASLISIRRSLEKLPRPAAQLLIYPVTDLRMSTASHQKFADGYILTRDLMLWFCQNFLPDSNLANDATISPLLSKDLPAQAPTIIVTASYDILRDEGFAFARLLEKAGGLVKYIECFDLLHGFLAMTGVIPEAAQACDRIYMELQTLPLQLE